MAKKIFWLHLLNWGIGHATRCIPIILQLKKNNFNVIIMSSGRSLNLLIQEFPDENFIKLEDYNVTYSSFLANANKYSFPNPKNYFRDLLQKIERFSSIIKDYEIDGIISDNRYGLYSNRSPFCFHNSSNRDTNTIFKGISEEHQLLFY